jgi:DNA helicase IV
VAADHPPDTELVAERRHLERSREQLQRMRRRTAGLDAHGGNSVSTEYIKAALWHRVRALEDDPEVPLFFGRIDRDDPAQPVTERFYVGRRHVSDEHGDPMVVDWRAGISRAFYRASPTAPDGVGLRRRFGFEAGAMTAYEDEHLQAGQALDSAILRTEIERPRVGPMRDIVATIQPDQDDIVRADLSTSVVVQGAPGTGKTAVGLHRAAFLLYTYREQVSRQGVLVVGPNDSFLRYIADVLPALGEIEATHRSVAGLTDRVRVRAVDDVARARLKGDERMAAVVRRAVWARLREPTEALVVPRGARRWRVPAYEVAELIEGLRERQVRYVTGRSMLAQRLAHVILVKMETAGDSPDDRVQDAVARSAPVRAYVDSVWPRTDPAAVVWSMLSSPHSLAAAADGVLDAEEQHLLLWPKPPRSAGTARWTLADAVLVDEAADALERTASTAHVVLDEAQDLSPMMLRAVGRRCATGSVTVLGDLAQATSDVPVQDWQTAMRHLGKPDARIEELTTGFRVPASVMSFATQLLPTIAPHLRVPSSARPAEAGDLTVELIESPVAAAAHATRAALQREGSIAVIVPDAWSTRMSEALLAADISHATLGSEGDLDARVDVVPASLAKGLEFDHVVLVEPAAIAAAEADETVGLRRLYVCLTRAVMSLCVLHAEPLPQQLAG